MLFLVFVAAFLARLFSAPKFRPFIPAVRADPDADAYAGSIRALERRAIRAMEARSMPALLLPSAETL